MSNNRQDFLDNLSVKVKNQTENDIVLACLESWTGIKADKSYLVGGEYYVYDAQFPYIRVSCHSLQAFKVPLANNFKFADLHKLKAALDSLSFKEFVNADSTVVKVALKDGQVILNDTVKIDMDVLEDIAHFVSRQ